MSKAFSSKAPSTSNPTPFWLRIVDVLSILLVLGWVFRVVFPADLRRGSIVLLVIVCGISRRGRALLMPKLFRRLFYRLTLSYRLRRGLAWGFAFFITTLGSLRALSLQYTLFDVGIYHQILWNVSQGDGFRSSISQADNFLRDHLSPSLALLSPLYRVGSVSPWVIGMLPGFLTGALLSLIFMAWWYLAENLVGASRRRRAWLGSAAVLGVWGLQTFWGNLDWGLHESLLAGALISWSLALYWLGRNRSGKWFIASATLLVLAGGVKESDLLVVAGTSLGLLAIERIESRRSLARELTWILIAITGVSTFIAYSLSDRDPGKNYFFRLFGYIGSDFHSFFGNLLFHPGRWIRSFPIKQDFDYLIELLIPMGIIPLLISISRFRKSKRLSSELLLLLGISPSLAYALLSSYDGLRNPNLHYFFEIIPILGVVSILMTTHLKNAAFKKAVPLWVVLGWFSVWVEPWRDFIPDILATGQKAPLISLLNTVPRDQGVVVEDFAGTWLASRRWAAQWDDVATMKLFCPKFYLFKVGPVWGMRLPDRLQHIKEWNARCRVRLDAKLVSVGHSHEWWLYQEEE